MLPATALFPRSVHSGSGRAALPGQAGFVCLFSTINSSIFWSLGKSKLGGLLALVQFPTVQRRKVTYSEAHRRSDKALHRTSTLLLLHVSGCKFSLTSPLLSYFWLWDFCKIYCISEQKGEMCIGVYIYTLSYISEDISPGSPLWVLYPQSNPAFLSLGS